MADDMGIFDDFLGDSLENKEKEAVKFKPKMRGNAKPSKTPLARLPAQQNEGVGTRLNSDLDYLISSCSTTAFNLKGKLLPQRKPLDSNAATVNIDEIEGLNQKSDTIFQEDMEAHTTFSKIDSLADFSLEPPPSSVETTVKFQPKETNQKGKGKKVTFQLPEEHRVLDPGPVTSDEINVNSTSEPGLESNSKYCESTQNSENITKETTKAAPDLDILFDFLHNSDPVPEPETNFEEDPRDEDFTLESEKRAKKESESKKPSRKRKKSCTDLDANVNEDSSPKEKEKLSHKTRAKSRKRRQVDPALLEIPEGQIDRQNITIKNLILLAEAKEKNAKKGLIAKKSSTAESSQSREQDEFDFDFDGDQIERNQEDEDTDSLNEPPPKKLNYHSYMNRSYNGRWSQSDTEKFYTAIRQFGPNFEMITRLFPNRDRTQIKNKYKNEEKRNPIAIHDATTGRLNDTSQYEKVIEILQIEPGKFSPNETNNEQEPSDQDGDGKKEEQQEEVEEQNYDDALGDFSNSSSKQEEVSNDIALDALFDWD